MDASLKLAGRVAFVTGGGRGIGGGIAAALAAHGADVAIFDLRDRASASATLEAIGGAGRRSVFIQGDVADRGAVANALEETASRLGRLDILVNNAAYSVRKPLLELEVADVERTWSVIQWGTFHCSQLAARRMVEQGQGGSILMISSVHAYRPFALSTAYNGAKAAINHMAYTWANELAPHRIRVNVIEPGWIDTPGEREYFGEERIEREGKQLLLGRIGHPSDIAQAACYLVSDEASYVTGTCLRVDGGYVLTR
jgi:glucose 1-dehydrogenase